MEEPKRILYVSSEVFPYMPESDISTVGRFLPQGVQELGKEIRAFMPRYGLINERRNQLHEVIRLSGMNIVIDGSDRPLVIKVSSISSARMQVYFIDNEDYFHRKAVDSGADGKFFDDNDERAIFFARGVLETVKKLRWKPDIIHCQGWMSSLVPAFVKNFYHNDPIFTDAKVVVSLYNDRLAEKFDGRFSEKLTGEGLSSEDAGLLAEPDGINLAKLAVRYSDGIICGVPELNVELASYAAQLNVPVCPYEKISQEDTEYIQKYNQFYDKILGDNE